MPPWGEFVVALQLNTTRSQCAFRVFLCAKPQESHWFRDYSKAFLLQLYRTLYTIRAFESPNLAEIGGASDEEIRAKEK